MQVGQEVKATVTVSKHGASRTVFATAVHDKMGRLLVDGTALALLPPDGRP